MHIRDFLTACRAFRDLGTSVGDQLLDVVLGGESPEDQNPAALRRAVAFLEDCEGDLEGLDEVMDDLRMALSADAAANFGDAER